MKKNNSIDLNSVLHFKHWLRLLIVFIISTLTSLSLIALVQNPQQQDFNKALGL